MAEVRIQEGESLENALRRFKRKVQTEDIIKEVKRHSFYLKPGEKKRVKQALARKRSRKKQRRGRRVALTKTRHPPGNRVGDGGGDPAWTAVITAVLTMSWAVQPLDRSLEGFFNPCSTGPMARAPARRSTSL